ncbi:hypothetical protein DPX39_040064400 [Trypanosoma brucei equiperdum]|uniref:Uncharacterized protein n=1 Tax=Trypanosoma brucei equiperdum TaxID=630700 RepID=A0A3L6L956_9TRYP|nr:hypothetical protein DPX39_040064400 [Trypanosoma brucei equiperdum]
MWEICFLNKILWVVPRHLLAFTFLPFLAHAMPRSARRMVVVVGVTTSLPSSTMQDDKVLEHSHMTTAQEAVPSPCAVAPSRVIRRQPRGEAVDLDMPSVCLPSYTPTELTPHTPFSPVPACEELMDVPPPRRESCSRLLASKKTATWMSPTTTTTISPSPPPGDLTPSPRHEQPQ